MDELKRDILYGDEALRASAEIKNALFRWAIHKERYAEAPTQPLCYEGIGRNVPLRASKRGVRRALCSASVALCFIGGDFSLRKDFRTLEAERDYVVAATPEGGVEIRP